MEERSTSFAGAAPREPACAGVSAEQLAESAKQGSVDAFTALVDRLQAPLFNFLRLRALSPEDAEELTQETFLRAWQQIRRYDSRWRFSTWLFTLGRRLMASRYRKLRRDDGGELFEAASTAEEPSTIASAREERENLWEIAGRVLSVQQRSALWLRYAEDLPVREIGRVLEKRETTVRVLLFRARERLAGHLEPMRDAERPFNATEKEVAGYPALRSAGKLAGGR